MLRLLRDAVVATLREANDYPALFAAPLMLPLGFEWDPDRHYWRKAR